MTSVRDRFEFPSACSPRRHYLWIAHRLEAYYLNMFRQYDMFFAQKGGAALIFGLSPAQEKPMVVN